MSSIGWILIAVICLAASGLPALAGGARSAVGAVLSAAINVLAAILALAGMLMYTPVAANALTWQWGLPIGTFAVGIDPIGLIFLAPIFLVSALGSIYGLAYWPQGRHRGNGRRLRFGWGMLAAGMAFVVLARDGIFFLIAWEVMALSAFVLIATEDHKAGVRQAAWVYLVATHIGSLCLFGFFALLHTSTRSFSLWQVGPGVELPLTALFILALAGFGMKAGIFPLHVWLPGAHANAPSHVSAVLSGVMLKMGVYGLIRVAALAPNPPIWWGAVMLGIGTISALIGIAYAVGQQDYKRMLAYSSIENIGIIVMGLGLALLGESASRPEWIVLGLGAALLHVLNHSLFKPLLFMGAGSLLHAVHTRRIDRLGGLAKHMPLTFVLFVVGSIAICGLPPLNGFVSELLLYVGLLKTTQTGNGTLWGWAALGVPAIAAVGAMAVTGFVRLLGAVFEGAPRHQRKAHDPPKMMAFPMVMLACGCVAIGVFPAFVLPVLEPAIRSWSRAENAPRLAELLPLAIPTWFGLALAAGAGLAMMALMLLMKSRTKARAGTWDCGYARPTARMQYTGASFVQMLVDLGAWMLWPRGGRLRVAPLFAREASFSREVPDGILDRGLTPGFAKLRHGLTKARGMQQASGAGVRAYLVYVLVIIFVLILAA